MSSLIHLALGESKFFFYFIEIEPFQFLRYMKHLLPDSVTVIKTSQPVDFLTTVQH